MLNSLLIVGRAILTEDPMKGTRKEDAAATSKTVLLLTALLMWYVIDYFSDYVIIGS